MSRVLKGEKLPLPKDLPRKGRGTERSQRRQPPLSSRRPQRRSVLKRTMEEEEPNQPSALDRRGSEDMVTSALPWEPPTDPASLADYQAMRVQWTSSMLASKLSAAGALRTDDAAASDTAASPVSMSPTGKPLDSPSPVRERSHHASRPALLISPDSSRRNSARGGARLNSLRAPLGNLMALSVDSGSCDDYTARSNDSSAHGTPPGRDRRDLAVAVPPRPSMLSRPGSGPSLIVGSRPSSHCSSRPSSAASSVASSSRPSSASHGYRGGVPTPSKAPPVSQRRMIAEYDGIISTVLPGGDIRSGGRLLLGAEMTARDEALLRDSNVTHIINCAGLACANHHPSAFSYLKLNLQDTAREDISAAFYDALDFIDAAIGHPTASGTVFVHCQHGVSRSATIVIAYLMWKQRLSYDDALDALRLCRPTINPNIGFACALLQWGASVSGPPATLQAWALQRALAGESATPLAEAGGEGEGGGGLAMRAVLLPATLLPALRGVSEGEEEEVARCRAEVVAEFKTQGLGCMVLQLGQAAACWLSADAPPAAMAEVQQMLARLVKYHDLPADYSTPPVESEGDESPDFWRMLLPTNTNAAHQIHATLAADATLSPHSSLDAVAEVAEAVRDVSMDESPDRRPPMTCTRRDRDGRRGFGGFGPPTHAALASDGPLVGPPTHAALAPRSRPLDSLAEGGASSAALGPPPFVVPSIITPGSTDRSDHSDTDSERRGRYAVQLPAAAAPSSTSSAPVRPSPLHSGSSAAELGEAMALAVLQTVASELLLLLQDEFDLLQPSPSKPTGLQPALGSAAEAEGVMELHPAHLLTVCQELLLAKPTSECSIAPQSHPNYSLIIPY